MSNYVTGQELSDAIAAVTADIRDTETRLRDEFTGTVRFEVGRMDTHLGDQDETLKWINRWALGSLVLVVVGLLYLIH